MDDNKRIQYITRAYFTNCAIQEVLQTETNFLRQRLCQYCMLKMLTIITLRQLTSRKYFYYHHQCRYLSINNSLVYSMQLGQVARLEEWRRCCMYLLALIREGYLIHATGWPIGITKQYGYHSGLKFSYCVTFLRFNQHGMAYETL